MFNLRFLSHPNILELYGWFQDEHRVIILLEFAVGGTLLEELKKSGTLEDETAARVINM